MGTIIAIEGTDGSGKETQSKRLTMALKEKGYKVRRLTFPRYQDDASILIRRYLAGEYGEKPDDVNPYAASLFYAADRYDAWMRDFGEFYRQGGILITDRYTTSNMIHQASKIPDSGEQDAFLDWLERTEYEQLGIPRPDLVFYLDIPVTISSALIDARAAASGEKEDIHEADTGYLARSAAGAARLIEKYGWTKIECTDQSRRLRSIGDIGDELLEKTISYLNNPDTTVKTDV
ncbi:MAG: dTMP kinase [Eubacteriaceae bacterium]|jgi:dTMP kinase